MKPNQFLDAQQSRLHERAGELLAAAELAKTTKEIVNLMREQDKSASMPGFGQIRLALWRALQDEAIVLPSSKMYRTEVYDSFDAGETEVQEGEPEDIRGLSFTYVSRLYCVTDDRSEDMNKLGKAISNWLDDEPKNKNVIFVQTVTPKDAKDVFEYQSVTFAAVQSAGGKMYWFTLEPNDNRGKIIPQEALQTEYGELRNTVGPIDKCPVKAVPVSPAEVTLLCDELKTVRDMLETQRPAAKPTIFEKVGDNMGKGAAGNLINRVPIARSRMGVKK